MAGTFPLGSTLCQDTPLSSACLSRYTYAESLASVCSSLQLNMQCVFPYNISFSALPLEHGKSFQIKAFEGNFFGYWEVKVTKQNKSGFLLVQNRIDINAREVIL